MPEKVDVKRAGEDDKMAMFRELAKHTKPTGASAKGKSEERQDEAD